MKKSEAIKILTDRVEAIAESAYPTEPEALHAINGAIKTLNELEGFDREVEPRW